MGVPIAIFGIGCSSSNLNEIIFSIGELHAKRRNTGKGGWKKSRQNGMEGWMVVLGLIERIFLGEK